MLHGKIEKKPITPNIVHTNTLAENLADIQEKDHYDIVLANPPFGGKEFKITGTLGIIHKAKQMSIIDKVRPLIDKLLSTDFRVSDSIIEEILKLNNK